MHRLGLMLSLAVLGGSGMAMAEPPTTQIPLRTSEGQVDKTTQTEDIRFRNDYYDRMTVPVRLSGTGPYRFLVDTGADRTAISRQLASRLNLTAGATASLHSVTEESQIQTATVPDLQLTRKNVRVIDAPLLESSNIGADGILGVDSLRSQRVLFDFEGRTMSIVPSSDVEQRDEPGAIVVTARSRNGRLVITEATANGRRLMVVLDTGSQITIGNAALRRQLLGKQVPDDTHKVELMSVTGGKISGEYMFIRELELGGVQLHQLAVVFAHSHAFEKLRLEDRPALLLGMNAMRAFKKVSIDFANRTFKVVLPERSELELRLADRL